MKKLLKWQQKYVDRLSTFTNERLIEEVTDMGDMQSDWHIDYILIELRIRLEKIGFLEEDK